MPLFAPVTSAILFEEFCMSYWSAVFVMKIPGRGVFRMAELASNRHSLHQDANGEDFSPVIAFERVKNAPPQRTQFLESTGDRNRCRRPFRPLRDSPRTGVRLHGECSHCVKGPGVGKTHPAARTRGGARVILAHGSGPAPAISMGGPSRSRLRARRKASEHHAHGHPCSRLIVRERQDLSLPRVDPMLH
jgi:hypothetical protein